MSQNGFEVDENWGEDGWSTNFPSVKVWAENKPIWDLGDEIKICTEISNSLVPKGIDNATQDLIEDLEVALKLGGITRDYYEKQLMKLTGEDSE